MPPEPLVCSLRFPARVAWWSISTDTLLLAFICVIIPFYRSSIFARKYGSLHPSVSLARFPFNHPQTSHQVAGHHRVPLQSIIDVRDLSRWIHNSPNLMLAGSNGSGGRYDVGCLDLGFLTGTKQTLGSVYPQIETTNVPGCVETGPDPRTGSAGKSRSVKLRTSFFFRLTISTPNAPEKTTSERCISCAFTAPSVLNYSACRPAPKKAQAVPRERLDVGRMDLGMRTSTAMKTPPLNVWSTWSTAWPLISCTVSSV